MMMRRVISSFAPAPLLLVLIGCAQPPAPAPASPPDTREADTKTIKDLELRWVAAFGSRDPDKIASFYSTDASVMLPGMKKLVGQDAAKAEVADLLKDPGFFLTFDSTKTEVSRAGDYAYSEGTYTMATTNPKGKRKEILTEKGKFVTVYKKQPDGAWKVVADINNADGPPTSAAPQIERRAP